MLEERRREVVALESEFQHVSIRYELGHLGHLIDRFCRSLLSICLDRRKDLALTTAVAAPAAGYGSRIPLKRPVQLLQEIDEIKAVDSESLKVRQCFVHFFSFSHW